MVGNTLLKFKIILTFALGFKVWIIGFVLEYKGVTIKI